MFHVVPTSATFYVKASGADRRRESGYETLMKEQKNEARLERKRRLAKALKANLARRKVLRHKKNARNAPEDSGAR